MLNKIFSLMVLIILSPIILLCMLLIILIDKQNPIFIQERIGKNKKQFNIIKLRTMKNNKPTKLGAFLRKYKIDEFTQFINVILGDMALIGPRPLLLNEYTDNSFFTRTTILPGLTGLHQIMGKTHDIKEKIIYDEQYINNKSFKLDLYIFYQTIKILFTGSKQN